MRTTARWAITAGVAVALGAVPAIAAGTATAAPAAKATKIAVHKIGTARLNGGASAGELPPSTDPDATGPAGTKAVANRSPRSQARSTRTTYAPSGVKPTGVLGITNPGATTGSGWQGLNQYQQRTADDGNQYTLTPPDQALCSNGSQLLESVNNAITVYSPSGSQLSPVTSLNQFYFGDHEIDRTTNVASPHSIGDPSCVWDAGSGRFFFTVYDISVDAAGNETGRTAIDIAVSNSSDATGSWTVYSIDTTNDGTNGTPTHPNCPCFSDYPHLGTDANGLYITTNEFPLFADGFNEALVIAISKSALTSGGTSVTGSLIDTNDSDTVEGSSVPGFTLEPAIADSTGYAPNAMYFLSSDAVFANANSSRQMLLWKLSGTSALASGGVPTLSVTKVPVPLYAVPPAADQRAGSSPLRDCLNVTACAKVLLGTPNRYKESSYALDSSDSRVLSATFVNGQVWGALGTAVDYAGVTKAGVAYDVVDTASGSLVANGTLTVPNNNITFPTLGVTPSGRAALAVTLLGRDYYPSQAFTTFTTGSAPTSLTISGVGVGPDDEFGGYRAFDYNRPRWGDYGAATVVDGTVYLANEYIAQTCTLAQYQQAPFGTCGGTRTALSNWSTHITPVTP